jgi:release factor glutamine methyltransferase
MGEHPEHALVHAVERLAAHEALEAARQDAAADGVADAEVRHSDVVDAVDGVFDLIVFDSPFRWFAPRSVLEAATTYESHGGAAAVLRRGARAARR